MNDRIWAIYGQFGKLIRWTERVMVFAFGFTPKQKLPGLTLYHFWGSHYSWLTRLAIYQMRIEIPFKDILLDKEAYLELKKFGRRDRSPCLRIETATDTKWMYESKDIIAYLKEAKSKPTLNA